MSARVAVVGASGRVGSAICGHLRDRYEVVEIVRGEDDDVEELARRSALGVDIVVNAAGVAHIESPTPRDLERLQTANVELPVAVAGVALAERIPMIHISSAKAVGKASSPYAASKRDAERRLQEQFDDAFAEAGVGLAVVRPLALLFAPLDVGRLRRLGFLRRVPRSVVPPVRMPVLTPQRFLEVVEDLVGELISGSAPAGLSVRDFPAGERGTLQDVRSAMLAWRPMGADR